MGQEPICTILASHSTVVYAVIFVPVTILHTANCNGIEFQWFILHEGNKRAGVPKHVYTTAINSPLIDKARLD